MAAGETVSAQKDGAGGGKHLIKDISFPFFNLSLAGTPLKGD